MQRVGPRARPLLHRVLQPPSAAATVAAREASEVAELQQSLAAYLRALEGGAAQHALAVARSRLPDAGRGVFLLRGSIPAGAVVTLYPGLMLEPQQFADQAVVTSEEAQAPLPPPFALGNAYLLLLRRQTTTLLVDGRPTGLSAARFAAEAGEAGGPVNAAWLEEEEAGGGEARGGVHHPPPQPHNRPEQQQKQQEERRLQRAAALGHLLNHSPDAQLAFDLCPMPTAALEGREHLLPALPWRSRGWRGLFWGAGAAAEGDVRWVPLVRAVRAVEAARVGPPLELFVNYNRNPRELGFTP